MMFNRKKKVADEVLEYQPDAVEIEEKPVPGSIRWVLYIILGSLILVVVGAIIFKVDRIVVAEGKLITTSPTIVIQSLNTAIIKTIDVKVGDVVEAGQLMSTLDSTFAQADLSQLQKQHLTFTSQIRRIKAELMGHYFKALPEEKEDGLLQEQLFYQHKRILEKNKKMNEDKVAFLNARLALNNIQCNGKKQQLKILRDVEGTTAKLSQKETRYRLQILEAQKARGLVANDIDNLIAERDVVSSELNQVKSEWLRWLEERNGKLMEEEVQLRNELEKVTEEIHKAERLHELVTLKATQAGIVHSIAERSVGSIIQPAEPFITLIPLDSEIEAEVHVQSKDIARIRIGDSVRVKLDAFPFQRHDTLPGNVRVISEDSFLHGGAEMVRSQAEDDSEGAFYRTRVNLLSTQLRDVPKGFRLQPGMKVRAEIKVGTRRVISYFLYPVIRAFDESLREP